MNVAKAPVLSDALKIAPVLSPSALDTAATTGLGSPASWSGASGASAIAFIDASVSDYQTLAAGIAPGTEVHILDSSQDAVTQITNTLLGRHNISSLHIVSHGEAGGLDFGSSVLNLSDLPQYAAQLQSWSNALTDDADILLYGCNVAQGELGKAFTSILSQLTGADVAASDDLTGNGTEGGNWVLEVHTGEIASSIAFRAEAMATYSDVLSPFTAGNLVTYRVGDGSSALSNAGTAVFLDEYTLGGSLVQSIALPTAISGSNRRLVASGTSTSEGLLNRSVDGQYLTLTGYDAAVGTASVASTASSTTNRVVAKVGVDGTIDTSTALTDFATNNNPRSAASTNGTDLWVTGGAGGVRYTTLGSTTSTQLSTTVTNLRSVNIFNGQLYISTSSGSAVRVGTVGTGTPTTTGQTITNLPGFPNSSGSPYSFFFADLTSAVAGVDTLYVADDTANQIQKFSLVSGSWTANGTITATTVRGLTGSVSGTTVNLFGTTNNNLYSFTDGTGYNTTVSGTATLIATATTNTAFRGVAFAPVMADPTVSLSTSTPNLTEGGTPGSFTLNLNAAAASALTVNFTLTGAAGKDADYTITPGAGISNFDPVAGTFTINAGVNSASFTIQTIDDIAAEAAEGIVLTLTGVDGGYGLGTASSTITIDQNDFVVTNTNDSSEGSLRQAVLNANAIAGTDIITFAGSTFNDATPDTITLASGLTLTDNVSILGTGANRLTIAGAGTSSFNSFTVNSGVTASFDGLTIKNSNRGIYNAGGTIASLSLSNSTFSNNNLGIFNPGGTITSLSNSTFSSNEFAGIYNNLGGTITSISNSEFSGNGNFGVYNDSGTITSISNNTFSSNATGIYTTDGTITTIVNNTIAKNFGGGINGISPITNLFNNLLVGNGDNTLPTATNSGNNLTGTFAALNVDATLRDNGGPTQTHALLAGSAAANAGDNSKLPPDTTDLDGDGNTTEPIPFDQRGTGFDRIRGGTVDIGAFEVQNDPPTSTNINATFNEDTVYTFSQTDFAFADTDGGTFTSVRITQLPGVGQLFLDNDSDNAQGASEAITANQIIAVADLNKLKFKPVADANGTNYASFQFQVNDGTSFSTASYTATLDVKAVNDIPSFTKGSDYTITAGAGVQTVTNWSTGFNPGPANESTQTVQAYLVTVDTNPGIFAVAPAIDSFGNLTYTPATNVATTTTATISVRVQDNGGTASGGVDTSTAQTFAITVKPQPILSINNVSHPEGNSGTTAYTFTVSLSNASDEIVTVSYATTDGTATVADSDYVAASGTLTFNANETSKTLTVNAKGDTRKEANETFQVTLTAPINGTIAAGGGTGTIENDDNVNLVWRSGTTGTAPTGTGENVIWQLNGFTFQSSYSIPSVADLNWQIISSKADFNGDGNPDLLWRNRSTGQNSIWELNNFTVQRTYPIPSVADLNWQMITTADFNGDGKPDILWRNRTTGEDSIWELNGATQIGHPFAPVGDPNWQIVDVADFTNDGIADILWRNRVTGANSIWEMGNFSRQSSYPIAALADQNWQIAGTGDFNQDGIADIVWHNKSTGATSIWQMNRTGFQSGHPILTSADVNWQIAGIADFGGDSTPDILWRNQQTNKEEIWQMNGFSYAQTYQLPNLSREWSVKPLPLP